MVTINKKYFSFIIVAIFIVLVFFFIKNEKFQNSVPKNGPKSLSNRINQIRFVKIAGQTVKVDLAETMAEQERGLSGRTSLGENEGMLFVFDSPNKNYFWMKDMNFPIDIIWIDANQSVIFIEKNLAPESYPKSFGPEADSKYVLEVPALFSKKNNLKPGEKVEFLP